MKYDGSTIKSWAGDSQWRAFRADLARFRKHGYSGWGSEGIWALAIYRLQRTVRLARPRWAWLPVQIALVILRKILTIVTLVDLHPSAEIGPGLIIAHGGPVRVHGDTKIGADCSLHHVCTVGAGAQPGGAVIGDQVYIGCHTSILGPVKIGDRATIAANSLVINDVPPGCTAIGVPAKILPVKSRSEPVKQPAEGGVVQLASAPAYQPGDKKLPSSLR
jgi:serine O-acetyltransferase